MTLSTPLARKAGLILMLALTLTSLVMVTKAVAGKADLSSCNGKPVTITTDAASSKIDDTNNVVYGRNGKADVVNLGGGNDRFVGGGGDDTICGGTGRDALYGGLGDDVVLGGPGDDASGGGFQGSGPRIVGGPGNDILHGGSGDDLVNGNSGNDMLSGDQGSDQLDAGSGKDVCAPVNGKSRTKVSGCEKTAKIP